MRFKDINYRTIWFFVMLTIAAIIYPFLPPFFSIEMLNMSKEQNILLTIWQYNVLFMIFYICTSFVTQSIGLCFGYKRIGNTKYFYKIGTDKVIIKIDNLLFSEYEYFGTDIWKSFIDNMFEVGDDENNIKHNTILPILYIKAETTTVDINNYLNYFITLDNCITNKKQKDDNIKNNSIRQAGFLKEELKNFKI